MRNKANKNFIVFLGKTSTKCWAVKVRSMLSNQPKGLTTGRHRLADGIWTQLS